MYLIRHKHTNQYLQKWFVRDKFGHWEDKPTLVNKTTRDKILDVLGDSIEVTYKKGKRGARQ